MISAPQFNFLPPMVPSGDTFSKLEKFISTFIWKEMKGKAEHC